MTRQSAESNPTARIEATVDQTATSVEAIHKSIAALPLEVMRQSGLFQQTADDVGDLQDRAIGAIYATVRDVNRRVFSLAAELLEQEQTDSAPAPE